MLHGETPVFITTAIVAIVAEVESSSTFRETCLEKKKNARNENCVGAMIEHRSHLDRSRFMKICMMCFLRQSEL